MADDVTLPGTGTVVAADDVSSVFFQKVKLDVGGDGVSVPAVSGHGTATGALRVELPTDGTGVISTVGTITNVVHVDDNSGSLTVDNGGTFAVQAASAGDVAHDSADSGNPLKIGFKAQTSPKGITLVADGDRTDAYADADGLLMVKLNTSLADVISERVTDTGGTSTAFTNFSAVASTRNYVTSIVVYNSSATAGTVDFRDGTAGSVLWTMPLPAGGGAVISSSVPLFKTTANTALAYDVSAALTTVTISVSGFQSKAG